jgi:hypothetical protein
MTAIEYDPTEISFHEATLMGIARMGSTVRLALESLPVSGKLQAIEVTVQNVAVILRDGAPIADLRMEMEDGEVLTLRREEGQRPAAGNGRLRAPGATRDAAGDVLHIGGVEGNGDAPMHDQKLRGPEKCGKDSSAST